jgi:hypothetical protein
MSFPGATGSSQGVTQLAPFDSFASAPGGLLSSLRITGSDPLLPSDEMDRIDPHPASIRPQTATAMTRFMSELFENNAPWSEFRSGGIGIRSGSPLAVAFSAANRFPLRRKML